MVCPVVYSYSIIYTYQNQVAIWVTISAVYLSIMVRDTQTFLTLCIMILICRPVPIDWDGFGDKAYYLYIYILPRFSPRLAMLSEKNTSLSGMPVLP